MPRAPALPREYRARTTAELHALASPARQELVAALESLQPCTAAELAAHLGRLPVSLYYHLEKLAAAGLVVEHDRRPAARGSETVYRLRAAQVLVDPQDRTGRNLTALKKLGASILRRALRLHDETVAEPPHRDRLRREQLLLQRTVRLDAAGLARVNTKLHELADLLAQQPRGNATKADTFYTVTLHLAPERTRGGSR